MRNAAEEASHLERIASQARGGISHEMAQGLSDEIHDLNSVLKIMPPAARKEAISTMNNVFDRDAALRAIPLMHMDEDGSLTVIGKDRQQEFTTLRVLTTGEVDDYERGRKTVAVPPKR